MEKQTIDEQIGIKSELAKIIEINKSNVIIKDNSSKLQKDFVSSGISRAKKSKGF